MNTIVWSDLAFLSFTDIAGHLAENYSMDVAISFDEEVELLLDKLRSFKNLCPPMKSVLLCGSVP
jgi:plasmid stabilization system protein ParE